MFSAEEALALLEGRTAQADQAGAAAVAAELEHMPLALDQAAAVIAGQRLGYAAYLAKLRALPAGDYLGRDERTDEQPYPQGVAKAVLLSLETARAADPLGVCTRVMEVMAMLSPAAVHRDLLRSAGQAGTLLGGGRRVAVSMVDQALERLKGWSLLGFSIDGQVVSVHCLVACVIRRELAQLGRLTMACRAAAATLETSAEALVKSPDHAAAREMLGQVTALLDHAGVCQDDRDGSLAATLRHLRLLALDHLVGFADSTPHPTGIGEPLTTDPEGMLGPSHSGTLTSQSSLAAAYQDAGQAAEAIPLFEQTLAGRERVLGPDHPETMHSREQPGARLPGRGPGWRIDPAAPAESRRPGAAAGRLPSRHPGLAEQPGQRLPGRRTGGGGGPVVRAEPSSVRMAARRRPPHGPWPHGTISILPARRRP